MKKRVYIILFAIGSQLVFSQIPASGNYSATEEKAIVYRAMLDRATCSSAVAHQPSGTANSLATHYLSVLNSATTTQHTPTMTSVLSVAEEKAMIYRAMLDRADCSVVTASVPYPSGSTSSSATYYLSVLNSAANSHYSTKMIPMSSSTSFVLQNDTDLSSTLSISINLIWNSMVAKEFNKTPTTTSLNPIFPPIGFEPVEFVEFTFHQSQLNSEESCEHTSFETWNLSN